MSSSSWFAWRALLGLVLLGGMLSSCAEPRARTEILVVFEADRAVSRVARDIQIEAFGGARGTDIPNERVQLLDLSLADVGGFPVSHALVPADDDPSRLFRVEGRLFDDQSDEPIATVRAISGYVEGRTLILRLRFYSRCLYLDPCEAPDESCNADGDCEPVDRDPFDLPSVDGGVGDGGTEPLCTTDIDCDDGIACTTDACLDGNCLNVPDDAACTEQALGRCDARGGCQYGVACDEGTTCVPGPCEASATCDDSGLCVRETACLLGQMCCGTACVIADCNDGDACTMTACDPTMSRCASAAGEGMCNDGMFCNGSDFCEAGACTGHTGNPCTGASTCDDSTGACVGCVADTDCPPDSPAAGDCIPLAGNVCGGAGEAVVRTTMWDCVASTCESTTNIGMMSCTAPPAEDGTFCAVGETTWSGDCMPELDVCIPDGIEYGMTTAYECRAGACVEAGAGMTSRDCAYTLPGECVLPDDAGTGCELNETDCSNGLDEDCDSMPDCADPDCFSECGSEDAGTDACVGSREDCTNGLDDDCNGLIDCEDELCAPMLMCVGMPDGGGCSPTEDVCDDLIDNDCDGPSDCFDPDCSGMPMCMVVGEDAG